MSRPTQAQLQEARVVLERIIAGMPEPSAWRAEAAAAYLQGAVAALGIATDDTERSR